MRLARSVEKGEAIYEDDIVDIASFSFGVDVPKDAAVVCVISSGWRKGMFYDFTPLDKEAKPREYDLERLLGSYMAYLGSQQLFALDEDSWSYLHESLWFPFVSLSKDLRKKVVGFATSRMNLDRLLPELVDLVKKLLPRMLQRWAGSPAFASHIGLLKHAAQEFGEGDYISCTAIVYPRIEGLLRTVHESKGMQEKASQRTLSAVAVEESGAEVNPFSWLLPGMFRRYLEEAYFANFEPGKPAKLSRNSLGHGVATIEEFNEKGRLLGIHDSGSTVLLRCSRHWRLTARWSRLRRRPSVVVFCERPGGVFEAAHGMAVRRHGVSTSRIGLVPLEPDGERLVAYLERRTPWDS